ncbi:MAG: DUF512 domain-containing protein [Clostridia bacterium]|nr:DUF512 domain-containing protein [Clostridia bacterium]
MPVVIDSVEEKSLAAKKKICPGDLLVSINGHSIEDVLDYQFYVQDTKLKIELKTEKGTKKLTIRKKEEEDIGLEFSDYLMDKQHSCKNKCIFCFIDQMPPGLRDTLYFKDDDSRLSFLFGNYITLTNLTEHEIQRIIEMHISPVNISVHTMDPELRCRMMNNRFAGESLKIMRRFADAGIALNAQLVLCPGYNDGESLTKTMEELATYRPSLQSVAAVPVGLTKYREGLEPLRLFTKEECADVIRRMNEMGDRMLKEEGTRLFYPSDEFYLKAELPLPDDEYYEDCSQLENGVGMFTYFCKQFDESLEEGGNPKGTHLTIATGRLSEPLLNTCIKKAQEKYPQIHAEVYGIRNDFFGEEITVAGLVTGQDILKQMKGNVGELLLIPSSMLRSERDMFLDDVPLEQVSKELNVPIKVIECDGIAFFEALML